MNPRSRAEPCHVVLHDEGQQHLGRSPEDQVREGRREERAPEPHPDAHEPEPFADLLRTRPSAPPDGRSIACDRIRATHTIETTNVHASIRNAGPGCPLHMAMSQPPIAGPSMRAAAGRMNWSSELAWFRSALGTRCGTIASKAGPKNARAGAEGRRDDQDVPELEIVPVMDEHAERSRRSRRDGARRPRSAPAPVEPVADDAAHEQEDDCGTVMGDTDDRERGRERSTARRPATPGRRGRSRRRSATRSSPSRATGSRDAGAGRGSGTDGSTRPSPWAVHGHVTRVVTPAGWIGGGRGRRSLRASPRGRAVRRGTPRGRRVPCGRRLGDVRRRR